MCHEKLSSKCTPNYTMYNCPFLAFSCKRSTRDFVVKIRQTEKASARSNSKLKTQGENLKNFDFDAFNGSPVIKINI